MTQTIDRTDAEHASHHAAGAPWRVILLLVALGVALRALLLLAAVPAELQSDEANYVYLALALERFGLVLDHHRYLWPPAHPWILSKAIDAFGRGGLTAVLWLQVAFSAVIGATTMLFAWRLFSRRAAVIAGAIWVVHLPLAAYTHLLWSEPLLLALLLPALWNLLRALDAIEGTIESSVGARLVASGALFGAALYVKELPLYLVPLAALLVFLRSWGAGSVEAFRRATLLPLTALVVVLPWTLRNHEVYDRWIVGGATLGENAYVGVNARYMNFDFVALRKPRLAAGLEPVEDLSRLAYTAPPMAEGGHPDPGWERREDVVHVIDRQSAHLRSAVEYAATHPTWTARTRVKKMSDAVTPLSFLVRSFALGHYPEESWLEGSARRPIVLWALALPLALLVLGAAGFFLALPAGPGRDVVATVIVYVFATMLLVSMSRFRVPIDPFLIVLSAGILAHGPATRSVPRLVAFGLTLAVLGGLWWISLPETVAVARMALGVEG